MRDPTASSERLFLALWPDAATRDAVENHAGAWHWPDRARRTRTERLHVTLHFLGAVPAARIPALREGLLVDWKGCALVLDKPTVWPGGMALLEATQVPRELGVLHAALAQRLEALDLAVEARRYRPHVTLARKAFGARPPAAFTPLTWRAGPGYLLVRTLPGGRGYEAVQAFG